MRLYDFDASLRELLFKAIARIEIALLTKMIHHFSLAHGAFWFADKSLSREERLFQENIGSVERELHRTRTFQEIRLSAFPPCMENLGSGVVRRIVENVLQLQ